MIIKADTVEGAQCKLFRPDGTQVKNAVELDTVKRTAQLLSYHPRNPKKLKAKVRARKTLSMLEALKQAPHNADGSASIWLETSTVSVRGWHYTLAGVRYQL